MKRYAVLALVLALLLASALLLNAYPAMSTVLPDELPEPAASPDGADTARTGNVGGKLKLAFSPEEHFYDYAIDVEIFANDPDAKIYYTTDGSDPTSLSQEYIRPLHFIPLNSTNVVPLKAVAVSGDTVSRVAAHTYFLNKRINSRFDTLIFSLSTDPEHLYDYDTGIFVAGRQRDEFIEQHPNRGVEPPDPANYNWRGREGERPMYVETFEPDGKRVVAQAAGIRVSGGWSRAADQKSLRLIARREYEPDEGKFHYDFFPSDAAADAFGTPIVEYDTLVLRNGANDREFGMLRHETAAALALRMGFREVTPVRPAAVFINGEYYGFAWLQVDINEQYLQDIYNAPTKDFEIIGDGDQWYNSDDTAVVDDLKEMYSYAWKNLRNDAVFAELEALVDIDNLLTYYAYEIYMGNEDWPQNNLKRWRYTGPQTDGLPPQLDGRWRYVMYDMDWVLGLYGDNYTKPTFRNVLEGNNKRSPLLANILTRLDTSEKFIMILCDIMANAVTEETVSDTVAELFGSAENEIDRAYSARKYASWVQMSHVYNNHKEMQAFAKNRGGYILSCLQKYFSYPDAYFTVEISGGEAVIGTQRGVSSRYLFHMEIPVSPVLPKYTVFDHWVLNGKEIYEPDITVSSADTRGGTAVKLELVTKYDPPALSFTEGYGSNKRNGCVLVNLTEKTTLTTGLYMSNIPENPFLWELPAASVRPGDTLTLVGKGSKDAGDLLKIQMGFAVRESDVLTLSDENGVLLDYIIVKGE